MAKKRQKNKIIRFIVKRRRSLLVWLGVLVGVYILGLINPFTGPALRYPYHVIYCGKKPIIAKSFKTKTYYLPEMTGYSTSGLLGDNKIYCTEQEAIDDGYVLGRW